jgi:hypothetical protein
MTPYEKEEVEIFTDVAPHGDISIEEYGTGIERIQYHFTWRESCKGSGVLIQKNVNEKIIGQKLSFLALTSENKVEFYSHSEEGGIKVLMTMEGFKHRYIKTTLKNWFK